MTTLKAPLPRAESELGRNRAAHGDKSYYYAHNEGWQVPEHAMVRSGPGLVTGGAPVKLGPDGKPEGSQQQQDDISDEVMKQLRARINELEREVTQSRSGSKPLTQFSFSDEGAKCKVYVEVGSDLLESKVSTQEGTAFAEAAVTVSFMPKKCELRVQAPKLDGTTIERRAVTFCCESNIDPEKCSYKIDRPKGRITLTLRKVSELKKWQKITTQAM